MSKVRLTFLCPGSVALSAAEVLRLDAAARRRLRLTDRTAMSSFELLTQASLDGLWDPPDDEWEVDALNWPVRHVDRVAIEQDMEFHFTRAQLEKLLARHAGGAV